MKKQVYTGMFALAMIFLSTIAAAQPGWNWCDPVDKSKERYALFSDNVKAAQYEKAKGPLDELLSGCEKLHVSLYQNGVKVYKGLADVETDAGKKKEYQEMALSLYDKRIELFGKEASVLNRKAFDAYKYQKGDQSKYADLLKLFDRTFELNGNKVFDNNIVAYFDVVRRYQAVNKDLSEEDIITRYNQLTEIVNFKLQSANDSKKDRLTKNLDVIDNMLIKLVDLNCEKVAEIYGQKLTETKDLKLAKNIFKLMLAGKCTSNPLAVEAATIIGENEPNPAIYKFLAQSAIGGEEKDYNKGIELYEKAIELYDDNLKKADLLLSIAKIKASQGQKVSARNYARQALQTDPSSSDSYKLIGDLYMNSFEDCKKGVSKVEDRAIFIAAYNMYSRAGSSTGKINAKAQFPSIDEIFSEGYKEGQELSTGCWIGETVKLERRPSN